MAGDGNIFSCCIKDSRRRRRENRLLDHPLTPFTNGGTHSPQRMGEVNRAAALLGQDKDHQYTHESSTMQAYLDAQSSDDEESIPGRDFLSPFQREKFEYYFQKFFDSDGDGFITYADFKPLQQRILKFTSWAPTSGYANLIEELHREFYECLQDKTKSKGKVSLQQWLDMWGRFITGAMGMSDFPYWVQLLPKLMFVIIDRNQCGQITKENLRAFYRDFIGIDSEKLEDQTTRAFNAMTAGEKYPLDPPLYDMIFANFLLGKNIHGPGKYIFGCFDLNIKPEPYKITFEEEQTDETIPAETPKAPNTRGMIRPRSYENMGLLK